MRYADFTPPANAVPGVDPNRSAFRVVRRENDEGEDD
jgi:hypothetical protein